MDTDILIITGITDTIIRHIHLGLRSVIIMTVITGIRGSGAILLTPGIHGGDTHIMQAIILIIHLIIMAVITADIIMEDTMEHITEAASIIEPGQEVIIL